MSLKIIVEYVKCSLCGGDNTELLFVGKDRLHYKEGSFKVVKCKNCGLIYTNPRPTKEQMSYYYPEEYGPYTEAFWDYINMTIGVMNKGKDLFSKLKNICKALILKEYYGYDSFEIFQVAAFGESLPHGLKKLLLFPFFLYFRYIYYRIPIKITGEAKILDIGCGSGAYITLLYKMGWEVYGLDVSNVALEKIHQIPKNQIFIGTLKSHNFPAKNFDLITMWHSLEHMPDPLDILKESHRITKENGKISILVPNILSIPSRIFKGKWMPVDIPRHLYHFSPLTIRNMLEKAGFRNINIRHLPYRSGIPESIRYYLEEKQRYMKFADGLLVKKMSYWLSSLFAILNKGEVILVSAIR